MKLFIACSSSNELDSKYLEESHLLLSEILKDNDLVYGAYNNGIMEIAYNLAKLYHREIFAITTNKYEDDLSRIDCNFKLCTNNIYRRSEELVKNADAIIILPGGIGTITELISSIETMRNNEFNKPILIYNMFGFYNEFFKFIDNIYEEKFSSIEVKKCYQVFNSKEELINYIKEC